MNDSTDALIAGAGPVGLLLAAELRRDGVAAHVVDPMSERAFFCKALGVTARTLEIFDSLGLANAAIDAGVWVTGVQTWQDGAPAGAMNVPETGLPYGSLSLAQFETERLLEGALAQHGGHVEYGTALEGFSAQADHVLARLRGTDGVLRDMRCRWLVGCDGARCGRRR
jgi:2-polyprenyl-6-methoxyphenol hydroxylase-like FAD-dependent oxidoreductase